jgi:hypothetical protein
MTRLEVPALFVRNDEPCYLLEEEELQSPGSRGWRRFQILTVVRDDRPAKARVDLGPRDTFTTTPFRILGGVTDAVTGKIHILHTVGELRDIADRQRAGYMPEPEVEPSDLIGGYHDLMDRRAKARKNVSVFGPRGHHQRSA